VLEAGVRERRGAVATASARIEADHREEVADATTERQQLHLRLWLRPLAGHCVLDHQLVAAEATPLERPRAVRPPAAASVSAAATAAADATAATAAAAAAAAAATHKWAEARAAERVGGGAQRGILFVARADVQRERRLQPHVLEAAT